MVQNNASMLRKVRHKIARETPYQIIVYFLLYLSSFYKEQYIYKMQVMIIGRWAKPIRSDSLFYNLSPVPRMTRYQRRQCILNQREYIVNLIQGDWGMMENRFKIVVSDWPHLVYVAHLQDLLRPTTEVIITFKYRDKNGNKVFRSRSLPHGAFE